ncbi:hypothetical protein AB4Z22_22245 [Paenibacillus sp. TAF58]
MDRIQSKDQYQELIDIENTLFKNGEKIAHLHSKLAKTPAQVREYLDTLH